MEPQTCDAWFDLADNVIVEADGSRKRPFKAPASHEPVIPSRTTLMIACIGANALWQPIAESCHRPELVAAVAGCSTSDLLTPNACRDRAARRLGIEKGLPPTARYAIAICRVGEESANAAGELAGLIDGRAEVVAIASRPL